MADDDDVREMDALHKDASAPQVETFDALQRVSTSLDRRPAVLDVLDGEPACDF
jgi:hypothetical protein